jgi:hypothetical protein
MNVMKLSTLGLTCSLLACESERLLWADFDEDTVGTRPAPNLPGDPAGDTFYTSAAPGASPDTVRVVNDTDFGRSLRYSNVAQPLYARYVGFIGADADASATGYYTTWVGKMSDARGASALDVWFGDSHFASLAGLRFASGRVWLKTSLTGHELLGTYASGVQHVVIINVNREADTYQLSFIQSGRSLASGSRPVLEPRATDTRNPSVYLYFSEERSSGAHYVIDEVQVAQSFPD